MTNKKLDLEPYKMSGVPLLLFMLIIGGSAAIITFIYKYLITL